MLQRKRLEEQGILLDRRRAVKRQQTFDQDDEVVEVPAVNAGAVAYRPNPAAGQSGRQAISRQASKAGREPDPDEEEGGGRGELDEEDRELLGEVDADESEEDEDEDMDD